MASIGRGLGGFGRLYRSEVNRSQSSEQNTTVSQRIQHLRDQKKSSKCRLTKAKICLNNLISAEGQSKTVIRRQIKKVKVEFEIVENIFIKLKQNCAVEFPLSEHVQNPDIDTIYPDIR